ncbi:MAG: Stp1/IreP family PP2C-type Ser/Thr phosphatase [Spirochaetota bacterium]
MFSYQVCGKTNKGLVRNINEDYFLSDVETGVFIVADGVGGSQGGDVASRVAAESILGSLVAMHNKGENNIDDELIDSLVDKAQEEIFKFSATDPSLKGMSTTVVFAVTQDSGIWIANIGDSRAYLVRHHKIELLTKDHSVVAKWVEEGIITEEEARVHPLRNVITQSIGLDLREGCYKRKYKIYNKDIFILCSDGLWNMLKDDRIKDICLGSDDVATICENLIYSANTAGGHDNITVIVIKVVK